MKTKFFTVVFLSFLSLSFAQSKFFELSARISKDSEFLSLSENLDKFSENKLDFETMNSLVVKDELSSQEQTILAKSLGFSNIDDLNSFNSENEKSMRYVVEKFSLQDYSSEDLESILSQSFLLIPSSDDLYETHGRTCQERYRTCKVGARALYFLEASACVGLGVGIAAGTFGSAAPIGALAATACVTAAAVHLGANTTSCRDAYDDCMEG